MVLYFEQYYICAVFKGEKIYYFKETEWLKVKNFTGAGTELRPEIDKTRIFLCIFVAINK